MNLRGSMLSPRHSNVAELTKRPAVGFYCPQLGYNVPSSHFDKGSTNERFFRNHFTMIIAT
jgi:hypothetical protein